MKKGILMTLPRHDDVTEYLSQFSQQIEDLANEKGIEIKSLRDKEAVKVVFEKIIRSQDYKMIVLNGHGSEDHINGYKETIIQAGMNDAIIRDRIVYARSCNAAVILGVKCTENSKEGCFIGYDRPFQFYVDIRWTGNPIKDNTARLFLESSNLVPISLIKGNSANYANENSKKQMLKNIRKIILNPDEESFKIAEALWNNYEGQVILGNEDASFTH
jgi:hypothetical protein